MLYKKALVAGSIFRYEKPFIVSNNKGLPFMMSAVWEGGREVGAKAEENRVGVRVLVPKIRCPVWKREESENILYASSDIRGFINT